MSRRAASEFFGLVSRSDTDTADSDWSSSDLFEAVLFLWDFLFFLLRFLFAGFANLEHPVDSFVTLIEKEVQYGEKNQNDSSDSRVETSEYTQQV